MSTEHLSERRSVIRGALSLAGLGVSTLILGSEGRANAADRRVPPVYTCCLQPSCAGTVCGGNTDKYHCVPNIACEGSDYCGCYPKSKPNCFQLAC